MKITMYKLLGLVKDGKAPKKIKYDGRLYEFDDKKDNYYENETCSINWDYVSLHCLNEKVEILEEEKKIPEKLEDISEIKRVGCKIEINIAENKILFDTDTPIVTEHCIYKINQLIKNQKKIIDYLKSKGE